MSDYEKINSKVKAQVFARRKDAIKRIVLALVALVAVLAAIIGLEAIGFISGTFMVILMSISVCAASFKTGYIWRDIKF